MNSRCIGGELLRIPIFFVGKCGLKSQEYIEYTIPIWGRRLGIPWYSHLVWCKMSPPWLLGTVYYGLTTLHTSCQTWPWKTVFWVDPFPIEHIFTIAGPGYKFWTGYEAWHGAPHCRCWWAVIPVWILFPFISHDLRLICVLFTYINPDWCSKPAGLLAKIHAPELPEQSSDRRHPGSEVSSGGVPCVAPFHNFPSLCRVFSRFRQCFKFLCFLLLWFPTSQGFLMFIAQTGFELIHTWVCLKIG